MFVVADGTGGCHNDDLKFHQWLQIVHDDNSNVETLCGFVPGTPQSQGHLSPIKLIHTSKRSPWDGSVSNSEWMNNFIPHFPGHAIHAGIKVKPCWLQGPQVLVGLEMIFTFWEDVSVGILKVRKGLSYIIIITTKFWVIISLLCPTSCFNMYK